MTIESRAETSKTQAHKTTIYNDSITGVRKLYQAIFSLKPMKIFALDFQPYNEFSDFWC